MSAAFSESTASYGLILSRLSAGGSRFEYRRSQKAKATCPAHDDAAPSLAIDYHPSERKTLIYCHAGCAADAVLGALGLSRADLYDDPMPEGRKRRPLSSVSQDRRADRKTVPTQKAPKKPVCATPPGKRVETARYTYVDVDGVVVGEKIRRECPGCSVCETAEKPAKSISWERPKKTGPGVEFHMPEDPPLYRLPELLRSLPGQTVYVGEGEKVVDAAVGMGLLATTKPGSASTRWNPEWSALFTGLHVVILADRDTPGYRSARAIRDALLPVAASVSVLHTPVETKGADLVDHLDAGLDLDGLVAVPEDVLDPDRATVPTISSASGTVHTSPASVGEPIAGDDGRPNRRDEYTLRHGEVVKVTRKLLGTDDEGTKQYETNFDVILGVAARIVRVEYKDTADTPQTASTEDEPERERATSGYVLELVHPKHSDQPVLMHVSLKSFDTGAWLHNLPWQNVYYKSSKTAVSQIRDAIRALSEDAERVPVYAATGWRRLPDGRHMYVTASGGITVDGLVPLRTSFPGRLGLLALPAPSQEPSEIRRAALSSLSIPGFVPEFAAVAMLGLVYRAPFGRCPSSICLYGLPGSVKTGVGTIVVRHHAPGLSRSESLLSISDTGSTQLGTNEVLYRLKDTIVLGDDSAPDRSVRDAAVRTSRLSRTQYNGEGRIRLVYKDGELDLDEQRGPRGSFIQTSEVLASTDSAQQRMLTIHMNRDEINLDNVVAISRPEVAADCALLTASYVQWIAHRYEELHAEVGELADHYAHRLRPYCGDRPAEHLGQFASGWHMMLRYLQEVQAVSAEEAAGWWATAWAALVDAADRERQLLANQAAHRRLLGYLASAFAAGRAHLVGQDGLCPSDRQTAMRYGWSTTEAGADPVTPPVLRAGGTRVGVVTRVQGDGDPEPVERLWLDHKTATRIAIREAHDAEEAFTATADMLTGALRQAGVIAVEYESVGNGRWVKPRRPMPGGRRRVWDLAAAQLDEGDGSGDAAGLPPRPDTPPTPQPAPFTPVAGPPTAQQAAAPTSQPSVPPQTRPASENLAPEVTDEEPEDPLTQLDLFDNTDEPPTQNGQEATSDPAAPSVAQMAAEDSSGPQSPAQGPERGVEPPYYESDGPEDQDQDDDTDSAAPTPWRAAVAVADVDGLHLPDGEVLPLPAPVAQLHAGRLAWLVDELGLGHGGRARGTGVSARWRPDDGQIYVTEALAEAMNLPVLEDAPADERRAALQQQLGHPFIAQARADGWTVERWGDPLRIWRVREGGGRNISAQIVIAPYAVLHGDRFLEDNPAPALIARRVQQLADTVGVTYRRSPGTTGHELLRAMRPKRGRRAVPLDRAELPPPALEFRNLYTARVWDRRPTEAELKRRFILSYDARAAYLSVCSSLACGRGKVEHHTAPTFDPKVPGYWLAKPPAWQHWGTFNPFGPHREDGTPRLYLTPTLAYAQKDLGLDIEVIEAWIWPDHYRMLEPWYKQLSAARKALGPDADPTVGGTVKDVYTHSLGLFNSDHLRGNPARDIDASELFRPDVQQAAMAAHQANLTRAIMKVHDASGLLPIAVKTDCVYWVVDDPDFATAVPGLKLESHLGAFKPEGAALAADIWPHLRPGRWFPTGDAFTTPEEWSY
ncbi:putative transcriptional regulator (plasmid) [Actinacidiphila reveromycinica]|uniref:Putative transcriptional regulator n=1 Tax=Actinacidiphila reveromycinica TaxID=659352 RepID=A0A7U3QW53_9ACTN|nr:hypothetical protein [Streptomyces sp. SN-593]BBG20785.1 putative transcriptional regulator [Streptomyces sp. SN-593]